MLALQFTDSVNNGTQNMILYVTQINAVSPLYIVALLTSTVNIFNLTLPNGEHAAIYDPSLPEAAPVRAELSLLLPVLASHAELRRRDSGHGRERKPRGFASVRLCCAPGPTGAACGVFRRQHWRRPASAWRPRLGRLVAELCFLD